MTPSTTITRARYARLGGTAKLRGRRPRRVAQAMGFAIATAVVLLTSGCAGTPRAEPAPSTAPTPAAASTDTSGDVVAADDSIDIGGREVFMRCWRQPIAGEPTVLLLSGSDLDTSSWNLMASDLAAEGHHLCAYDRLGVGRSDPPQEARRTTKDQIDDLVALLDAANLQEPVVVAAHSLGSLPAVGLVERAPERVAGVVLVDPWSPRVSLAQRAALPPKKPGPFFGDLPVVVLQAPPLPYLPGLPRGYHRATVEAIDNGAAEFAAESRRGAVIQVEDTGHDIQDDQPEVVMKAITDVIADSPSN